MTEYNDLSGEYSVLLAAEANQYGNKELFHVFVIEDYLSNYQVFRLNINGKTVKEFSSLSYAVKFYSHLCF